MSLDRSALSAAAFLALALAWAAGACHAADAPAKALLPKAMASLSLGMSEADFRKVRPAAERFEIFGEPEVKGDDPNPWYTEPLKGDPFFELATYTFGGHRLCAVALSAVGQGEAFRQRQARVLQGGVRKWGSRYERLWQVSAGRGAGAKLVRRPALLWKLDSYRVLAKFSAGGAAPNGREEINVAILDPRCLPANVRQDLFNTLVPANDPGADAAFKVLDAPVEPPLLE
jgi:hypothetical protein